MNYFFDFDYKIDKVQWSKNGNMLILDILAVLMIVSFCKLFYFKEKRNKIIAKIFLACLLFVLEIGRIIYSFLKYFHDGGTIQILTFDRVVSTISFQMCSMMTWLNIVTLLISVFAPKSKILTYFYNIIYGCGMVGAFMVFIDLNTTILDSSRPFLHFRNIQTYLVHVLWIYIPIHFIVNGDFKVRLKNVWYVLVGYAYVGSFAMPFSLYTNTNYSNCLGYPEVLKKFELPFPFHVLLLLFALFLVAFVKYAIHQKVSKEEIKVCHSWKVYGLFVTIPLSAIIILVALAKIIGIERSPLCFMCFIPAILMTISLIVIEKKFNFSCE